MRRLRPRPPRAPDLPLLVVAAAAVVIALIALRAPPDDAFWQAAYGGWMLAHRALPRADVWSWTMAGRPVMATEWLFELAAGSASAVGPWASLPLALAGPLGLGLCALGLYGRLARSRPVAGLLALALLLLAAPFEAVLPQAASFALFAAVWWTLERARVAGPRPLAALPALFALWANLHGTYFAGIALVALDTALAWLTALRRRRSWPLGRLRTRCRRDTRRALPGVLGASAVATLLNPYGWRLYAHDLALATSPFHLQYIAEFASPNFHDAYLQRLLLPAILGALGLAVASPRRPPAREVVTALALIAGALVAVRVMPYALVALGALAASVARGRRAPTPLAEGAGSVGDTASGPGAGDRAVGRAAGDVAADVGTDRPYRAAQRWALAAVPVAVVAFALLRWPPPAWPPATGYPARAASYVAAQAARLGPRGFNTYEWGGYLLWRWRGAPRVYVDSRGDFYDTGTVLAGYVAVLDLRVDPGAALRRQGVTWALLPRGLPLAAALRREGWRVAYADRLAVVLTAAGGGRGAR